MKNKFKSIFTLGLAAFMAFSLAIVPVDAKGGSVRAGSVARPAVTRSVSSTPKSSGSIFKPSNSGSVPKSSAKTSNSGTVKNTPTRTGNSGTVNSTTRPSSYTSVNHYYGNYGSGFDGFMGGFWGGMMAGSLMHPWGMYYPVAGGSMGYTAAPMAYMILYLIVDLIIFLIVCVVLYKIYKWIKRRNKWQ